jgi:hypothetical protein
MNTKSLSALLWAAGLLCAADAVSGEPEVVGVEVTCSGQHDCNFSVTLRHADAGWNHYADRWEVVTPNGELLATRTLLHPHVEEQPFTRSLNHVAIPDGVDRVIVRAHDLLHGYGEKVVEVRLQFP